MSKARLSDYDKMRERLAKMIKIQKKILKEPEIDTKDFPERLTN